MRKKKSPWGDLARRSSGFRKGLEKIVQEADELSDKENCDAIQGVEVLARELKKWDEAVQAISGKVKKITNSLEEFREVQIESFHQRFVREITERGHEVYGETSPLVVNGIVHIETNLKKGRIRINGNLLDDFSHPAIAAQVEAELGRIGKLITPPEQMLGDLYTAYEYLLNKNGKPFGTPVETTALQFRIFMIRQSHAFIENPSVGTFREYPREVYRADLYALLKAGINKLHGKKFMYASGSDTNGAVFLMIPSFGRTAHIGRIWFEEGGE